MGHYNKLPLSHITIRVPWHDFGWAGCVCKDPLNNTSCMALSRIGEGKSNDDETKLKGIPFCEIGIEKLPPCVDERVSFMSSSNLNLTKEHPYVKNNSNAHKHFLPTNIIQKKFSAMCVPFRWLLLKNMCSKDGDPLSIPEKYKIDFSQKREPELSFSTSWVQDRENQLALLETFFSAIRPDKSLCFFYAKKTPLSEQSRRVIIGVGRVKYVDAPVDYEYSDPEAKLKSIIWERNVGHSIRNDMLDGFIFPYVEILEKAKEGSFNPEEYLAFAPDELHESYSYASELLSNDGAVSSLIACNAALQKCKKVLGELFNFEHAIKWIDKELNVLWKKRGAYPGLGSALNAFGFGFGFKYGTLLAYEIELEQEDKNDIGNPWDRVDEIFNNPNTFKGSTSSFIKSSLCKSWKSLPEERKSLLYLLSRLAITEEQALRIYDTQTRNKSKINCTDRQILDNPYLIYEQDTNNLDNIIFGQVDRGVYPEDSIRMQKPLPIECNFDDPADPRRIRSFVLSILEKATEEGHSLLPRSWVISRARELSLKPSCPLGEDVLSVNENSFGNVITITKIKNCDVAYQIKKYADYKDIISREIKYRMRGQRHKTNISNWPSLIEKEFGDNDYSDKVEKDLEYKARSEKSAALEELYKSRFSVLIGPAGTGKTSLLKIFCDLDDIKKKEILLLAPTGKARVRLEEQTRRVGKGFTIAQFLNKFDRYNVETSSYIIDDKLDKTSEYSTVIIDECSMLTEDEIAALFNTLQDVERYIFVGDPKQLPPIGVGKPFFDIINYIKQDVEGIEFDFPRCARGYIELTVPRRQKNSSCKDSILANQFTGNTLDTTTENIWDVDNFADNERIKCIQWEDPKELGSLIIKELIISLKLKDKNDELGFEYSLGGTRYSECKHAFFDPKYRVKNGSKLMVDNWQILSPIRNSQVGVDYLNKLVQEQFRRSVFIKTKYSNDNRKIPKPMGSQNLLYGDKVVNLENKLRYCSHEVHAGKTYVSNGDLGIIVGPYKSTNFTEKDAGRLEIEYSNKPGYKFYYWESEFSDNSVRSPLELAYALTVHKTQGSEFGISFLILPNPCWLLSRELLYTALTRHRDKIVILHQGPLSILRDYTRDIHSEINKRITNLFIDPDPREIKTKTGSKFLENSLIHLTDREELVRSKSEVIIANKLYAKRIDYVYEQPLNLKDGMIRYPDFTINIQAKGIKYYWEHLGLVNDPEYMKRWAIKLNEYESEGIMPIEKGVGENGVLIVTKDKDNGGFDSKEVNDIIDKYIL